MRFFNLTRSFEAIFLAGVGLGVATTVLSFLEVSDTLVWAVALAWAVWSLALMAWLAAMLFGNLLSGLIDGVRSGAGYASLRGRRRGGLFHRG